jgi:hypothetical protein
MRFKIHIVCSNKGIKFNVVDMEARETIYSSTLESNAEQLADHLNSCPWEVCGFFEEFIDLDINKTLGWRGVTLLDRPLGAEGREERVITEPLLLTKGMKQVRVPASPQRPIRVAAMLQIRCGWAKSEGQK